MSKADYPDRLAGAALDARDWLRTLLPELDAAIHAGRDTDGLLGRIRNLATFHADGLRMGLKRPSRNLRQNADSARSAPVWGAFGDQQGPRYLQPARRPRV
jgi:hypothetical protein